MFELELQSVVAHWYDGQSMIGHGDHRSVSFEAHPGEWIAVIGENGVGKSTLLHAVAGTVTFAAGRILFGGEVLSHGDAAARFRAGIQHVPQHARFATNRPYQDALDIFRTPRPAFFNERALQDLEERLKHLAIVENSVLSPRMFDLVTAIMSVPRVLLLDEIIPAWPKATRPQAYSFLKELLPYTTVIFIEHEIPLATECANRILWLQDEVRPSMRDKQDPDLHLFFRKGGLSNHISGRIDEEAVWQALRLEHSPRSELRLAIQASARNLGERRDLEQLVFGSFDFLCSDRAAERLSGGQKIILLALFLQISGLGTVPEPLMGHLDATRRSALQAALRKLQDRIQ